MATNPPDSCRLADVPMRYLVHRYEFRIHHGNLFRLVSDLGEDAAEDCWAGFGLSVMSNGGSFWKDFYVSQVPNFCWTAGRERAGKSFGRLLLSVPVLTKPKARLTRWWAKACSWSSSFKIAEKLTLLGLHALQHFSILQ